MRNNNNTKQYIKPVTKTIDVIITGKDSRGRDYDPDSVKDIVAELNETGAFKMIVINAFMSKKEMFGKEDAKGSAPVARIDSYDEENGTMELTFFGNNVKYADMLENKAIVPFAKINRDGKADFINRFDIVNAMES